MMLRSRDFEKILLTLFLAISTTGSPRGINWVNTNLKAADGCTIVRSRDFDKTLSIPFGKRFVHKIQTVGFAIATT